MVKTITIITSTVIAIRIGKTKTKCKWTITSTMTSISKTNKTNSITINGANFKTNSNKTSPKTNIIISMINSMMATAASITKATGTSSTTSITTMEEATISITSMLISITISRISHFNRTTATLIKDSIRVSRWIASIKITMIWQLIRPCRPPSTKEETLTILIVGNTSIQCNSIMGEVVTTAPLSPTFSSLTTDRMGRIWPQNNWIVYILVMGCIITMDKRNSKSSIRITRCMAAASFPIKDVKNKEITWAAIRILWNNKSINRINKIHSKCKIQTNSTSIILRIRIITLHGGEIRNSKVWIRKFKKSGSSNKKSMKSISNQKIQNNKMKYYWNKCKIWKLMKLTKIKCKMDLRWLCMHLNINPF